MIRILLNLMIIPILLSLTLACKSPGKENKGEPPASKPPVVSTPTPPRPTTPAPPPPIPTPPPPTPAPSATAGIVHLGRTAGPEFDSYSTTTNGGVQSQIRSLFSRMLVYTPFFDDKLSWYSNGWAYYDAYAIYRNSSTASNYSHWILRDSRGNKLYINYDCSGGVCPQYAGDIGNSDFRKWWIAEARNIIEQRKYKGLFIDDVNFTWSISNGQGQPAVPMNPRTGRAMTLSEWRQSLALFLQEIREAIPQAEIVHNSVWFHDAETNYGAPELNSVLSQMDYYFVEHGVADLGITGGTGTFSLFRMFQLIDRIHSLGKNVILAGLNSTNTQYRKFTLGCYFLISNGKDMIFDHSITPNVKWSGYSLNLGNALGARYTWQGIQRRDFEKGMVLVLEPGRSSIVVQAQGYRGAISGQVDTFVLEGRSALILNRY